MATKSKSKSKTRTSNSNLTKKAHVPVWAIVFGLVVLVGLGAFFVFESFASGGRHYLGGSDVTCGSGNCFVNPGHGNQGGKICYPIGSTNYYCTTGGAPMKYRSPY